MTDTTESQDQAWLAAIAADPSAAMPVNALFQRYRKPLLRFCGATGLQAADAEEVVQDAFVKMVRNASSFRGDAKVSTWLHQITRNLCIDRLRQNRPELQLDDEAWAVIEDQCVAQPEQTEFASHGVRHNLHECFDRAFETFRRQHPAAAQAISGVVHMGWGISELAQALDRTEGATREYLSQCRKKLKAFVEPCQKFLSEAA